MYFSILKKLNLDFYYNHYKITVFTSLGRRPAGPGNFLFTLKRLSGVTGNDVTSLLQFLFEVVVGVEHTNDTGLVTVVICESTNGVVSSEDDAELGLNGVCRGLFNSFSTAGFFEGGRPSESVASL